MKNLSHEIITSLNVDTLIIATHYGTSVVTYCNDEEIKFHKEDFIDGIGITQPSCYIIEGQKKSNFSTIIKEIHEEINLYETGDYVEKDHKKKILSTMENNVVAELWV